MSTNSKRAVVLLSGGLDSTTMLAIAKAQGFELYTLTFCYAQKHAIEAEIAEKIARNFGVIDHKVLDIDPAIFGNSALTGHGNVPKHRSPEEMSHGIPTTYVPARNTIFLSYALAFAEVIKAQNIFIGVNAIDYSGYPDCRPEYISAFEKMARLATKSGVEGFPLKISTPLINLSKAEIINKGIQLGVDYATTHSCYDPSLDGLACGACDSCLLRKHGFAEAEIPDPTRYFSEINSNFK